MCQNNSSQTPRGTLTSMAMRECVMRRLDIVKNVKASSLFQIPIQTAASQFDESVPLHNPIDFAVLTTRHRDSIRFR